VNAREVVLLHDDTLFGNAKTGFLLTETAVFWRHIACDAELVAFKDVHSVERRDRSDTIVVNGKHLFISSVTNDVLQAMEKFLRTLAARNRE
jgi:hypothetical protein